MAAKKPTRVRTASKARKLGFMDRHVVGLKFANYGAAGLFGGYLLMFTLPDAQKSFTTSIEKQAEQNREDRKAALDHGERAVERVAKSIDGLRESFGSVQGVTHGNQSKLLHEQQRTNELLEGRMRSPLIVPKPPEPNE